MIGTKSPLSRWAWLAAVLLMLGEFVVFDRMTSKYHAHIFPRWTDETQYLSDAYSGYESVRQSGFWSGLRTTINNPVPQGKLHDVLGVVVFSLVGSPSRSAALSLNLLAFVAWQAVLLFALARTTGSSTLGWIGFGLPLCLRWPWSVDAGSAVDFRLDHGAMCLMGIAAALALLTKGFRLLRWSLVFGVVVGLTVVERFLTGTYFALIFFASGCWVLFGADRWIRLRNLVSAGLAAAAVALPFFWPNRQWIYNYYWVGHLVSADGNARAPGLDLWESLKFIGGFVMRNQLGLCFLVVTAALFFATISACVTHRRRPLSAIDWDGLFLAVTFLVVPVGVLCLHRQKSEFVLGIVVPGIILGVAWILTFAWTRIDFSPERAWPRVVPTLSALGAVAAGESYFLTRQLTPPHTAEFSASARSLNHLADYLATTSRRAGLTQPAIGTDQLTDTLDGRTMTVLCYERQKSWLGFRTMLPTGILEEKDDLIMNRLQQCDFVLLTDAMLGNGYYPFDHQMRRLYPQVKEWCETHLRRIDTFPMFDRTISLYQRRDLPQADQSSHVVATNAAPR
ncbi:MAG: hypothetical protein JWM35_2002 [Verrucomicrobia bacterium]|nr:hypothetical protein [Verrucomicrobiota bacterium]